MGSANDALCELLRDRGLVQEDRLRDALRDAESSQIPLEQVLLRRRELGPAEAQAALMERRDRGRNCRTCARVTYLLSHGSEQDTPCERCGGRLLPGVAQRLTRATLRKLRPLSDDGGVAAEPRASTTAQRRTQSHPQRRLSIRHAPRTSPAGDGLGPRIRDELDRYLEQLQLVRRAVREAREAAIAAVADQGLTEELGARLLKLEGLLDREGIPGLGERLQRELSGSGGVSRDELERLALGALKRRLTEPDVRPLVTKMFDKAAKQFDERMSGGGGEALSEQIDQRAAEAARLVLDREHLTGLAQRTQAKLEALEKQLAALQGQGPAAGADLGPVEERLAALEQRAAKGPGGVAPALERRLAEMEQRTPDALELEQRLSALEQRAPGEGGEVDLEGVAMSVTETLRGDLEDLRASAREDAVRQVEAVLPELQQQARDGVRDAVLKQVDLKVEERVDQGQLALLDQVRRERAAALAAFSPPPSAAALPPPPAPPTAPPTREVQRDLHEVLLESLRGLLRAGWRRLRPMGFVFVVASAALLMILASLPTAHTAEAIVGPRGLRHYDGPARRLTVLATSEQNLTQIADRLELTAARRFGQVVAGWPADRSARLGAQLLVSGPPGGVEHIAVQARGETAEQAKRAATLLTEQLLALETELRGGTHSTSLTVLRPAEVRTAPPFLAAWPSAFLAALSLALLAGLLLELRRPVYHGAEQAARDLGLPILAVVPRAGSAP